MDQGIIVFSANLRVAVWNPRACALLDLPQALLERRPAAVEVTNYQLAMDYSDNEKDSFRRLTRDGALARTSVLYERRRPNGRVIEVKSTPMPNGGIIRTYTDVTDQRLAAERPAAAGDQAESARAAAERANDAKTDFLANRSHEIRMPMNGVIGMNMLLLRSDLTADQRECAVGVRESAEALLNVIDDILGFAKLEASKVELELSDFHLGNTVRAAVGLFKLCVRQAPDPDDRNRSGIGPLGVRRPGAVAPGADQPSRQRGEVHPARRSESPCQTR